MVPDSMRPQKCVLFTFQNLSPNSRKTGMTFIADALARAGHSVSVVTVQLSWLSRLAKVARLKAIDPGELNRWVDRGGGMRSYVWFPLMHPFGGRQKLAASVGALVAKLYPYLLPRAVEAAARDADIIVIESCAAVALFGRLRRLAPQARFIYCASDRLDIVGMNPALISYLDRTAEQYALIRIPAEMMRQDFPPQSNVAFLPHGLDKAVFDHANDNPYDPATTNAVVAGDMNSDIAALNHMIETNSDVRFHIFGKINPKELTKASNIVFHGEVGFTVLAPFIKFADIGLAPYRQRAGAEYLAQSSLKLIQYTYCRLPVVAPAFVKAGREHVCSYEPGNGSSITSAMLSARSFDRKSIDTSEIRAWDDVADEMLRRSHMMSASH